MGAKKGHPISEETKKKLSDSNKGKKRSNLTKENISKSKKGSIPWNKGSTGVQTAWNKGKKGSIPWNKGNGIDCSVEGCKNKHQAKGFCDFHYRRFLKGISFDKIKHGDMGKQDCKFENCKEKAKAEYYCEKHYNIIRNARRYNKVIQILGGKCDSCGEIHDDKLQRSNLEIHHRYYDEIDDKQKKEGKKRSGSQLPMEILRMVKKTENPLKKFALLCGECHRIETFSHQNPKKTFDMFAWLYSEGLFDETLKDNAGQKKLSEFMN